MLDEVLTGHQSTGEVLRDFCVGEFLKSHPMFLKDSHTLTLAIFYDELGVGNPLGSRKSKHKLGMYVCVHYVSEYLLIYGSEELH